MKRLTEILKLSKPKELIDKLVSSNYSFAAWQKPNSSEKRLIISLSKSEQIEEMRLAELSQGFLINQYNDSHPIRPYYISADIIINGNEIKINPSINDSQIDKFKTDLNDLKKAKKKAPESKKTTNEFESLVELTIDEIKKGTFEKVVLSRFKDYPTPEDFSAWEFFEKICQTYKNAFCSLTYIPNKGLWIGATPELLISNTDKQFRTVSLAGTKRLEDNQNLGEIAWTQKEIEEQAFVSRYIINCFKKIRLREFHEHGPKTIQAGTLAHLKTEFIVDFDELAFDQLADQMLNLLHPTSAVCGMPIETAKPWVNQIENYDREFYSGFLGPVNFERSTDLFVNLRCMKVQDGVIRFYAGAGITEDSNPQKEFDETEMKMNILHSKLQ